MRNAEWVVVGYLGYLAVVALVRPVSVRARLRVLAGAAGTAAVTWALSRAGGPAFEVLRDWVPIPLILVGYWLSGHLFTGPMPRAEARLLRVDRWLFEAAGVRRVGERAPRAVLQFLEAGYVSVYPLLPAGFAVALLAPGPLDVDRYWTTVVLAELVCYAALPWIQTRTPRALGDHMAIDARDLSVRRLNASIQRWGSIEVNTVPSGHAAGALATALAVGAVWPAAGLAFGALALLVSVGAVVGRYHYAADVVLGLLVAVTVWRAAA